MVSNDGCPFGITQQLIETFQQLCGNYVVKNIGGLYLCGVDMALKGIPT
jgi:hypothetical protein